MRTRRTMCWWCVWLSIACAVVPGCCFPPSGEGRNIAGGLTGTQGAQYFRSAITQQNMQTILSVIEERLRGLDGVYAARSQATQQLDTCTRRLDAIEGKIDRLESVIGFRLDKLSEAVGARSLKDQVMAEHVGRTYDSLQHRMDMASVKLQTMIESGLSRVERGQMHLAAQQAGAGWAPRVRAPDDNATAERMRENIVKPLAEKISSATASLNASVRDLILQQQQNDQTQTAGAAGQAALHAEIRGSVAREATTIANKMSTMYMELWRRGQALEALAKDSMAVANATRREFQDGLRAMMMQMAGRRHHHQTPQHQQATIHQSIDENSLEQSMDTLGTIVQKKLTETNRKMDARFQEVIMKQNLFLESCHRIQLNEPQLESQVHEVLDKLLERFMNITANTYNELQDIQELIKSRNSHVSKSISHMSNAMVQHGQRQHKAIMRILDDIRSSGGSAGSTGYVRAVSLKPIDQKITGIMTLLQEIQEQITYAKIQRDETEKNNTNLIIAELSKQVINAVSNITKENEKAIENSDAHAKRHELFSLIEKLVDMTNGLDSLFLKLEDRIHTYDKYHSISINDDNYEIDEMYDSEISNITSPTELFNKLRKIDVENAKDLFSKNAIRKVMDSFDDLTDFPNGDKLFDDELEYEVDYHNITGATVAPSKYSSHISTRNTDNKRNRRRHLHKHTFDRGPTKRSERKREYFDRDVQENDDFNVGNKTDEEYIELSDPDYDNDDIEYPIGKSDKATKD